MKVNKRISVLLIGISWVLAGCENGAALDSGGDKGNPIVERERTTCTLNLSEERFLQRFEVQCSDSRLSSKSIKKYFRALSSLRYEGSNEIDREFFGLRTWLKEIESFEDADGKCAASILCGESS